MTTEIFIREWRNTNKDNSFKAEDVFRRKGTTEVMTRKEFNEYYKKNESKTHHIVVI